jgi:flagellar biosynthetic protein FliR
MTYFFVVMRTGALLFTVPIFGNRAIRAQVRMAITLMFAMIIYPFVPPVPFNFEVDILFLILQILKEILIGVAIGTMTSVLFAGVQMGGYILDFQMGFSMVNIMDPETGGQFSYMAQVQNVLLLLMFIAIGGPALILQAIAYSFTTIPTGSITINANAFLYAVMLMKNVFIIAVTLTAPPLIVLMATNTLMGVLGKVIPLINLMVVGFPIKISVGLLIFVYSLQYFIVAFEKVAMNYFRYVREFMNMYTM